MREFFINNPLKGRIEYQPYKFQTELLAALNSDKQILINTSRQMGLSTTLALFLIDKCLEDKYECCVVGYDVKTKKEQYLQLLKINGIHVAHGSGCIQFDNMSVIYFETYKKFPYQTAGCDHYIEDLKFYEQKHEFILNMSKSYKSHVKLLHNDLIMDDDNLIKISWPWNLHPDRDQGWYDKQVELLGLKSVKEEIDVPIYR